MVHEVQESGGHGAVPQQEEVGRELPGEEKLGPVGGEGGGDYAQGLEVLIQGRVVRLQDVFPEVLDPPRRGAQEGVAGILEEPWRAERNSNVKLSKAKIRSYHAYFGPVSAGGESILVCCILSATVRPPPLSPDSEGVGGGGGT